MKADTGIQIVFFGLLLLTLMTEVALCADAADMTAPRQAVTQYLTSLVSGDTRQLKQLIGGRMKQNNRQLEVSPVSYSQFLRAHYADVETTIEEIVPDGERVRAKVRFDYSSNDSSLIEFILLKQNGSWRIVEEVY